MSGGERGGAGGTRRPAARRSVSALIDAVFSAAPETTPETDADTDADLQSVLASAVGDLARRTAAPRVCAWLTRDGEPPLIAAARWTTPGEPSVPAPGVLTALRGRRQPCDLGAPGVDPAIGRFAHGAELSAAIAVAPSETDVAEAAPVVLALGGPDDPPGRVRPRTLAMLEDVASRLRGPLATQLSMSRMARLDEAVQSLDRRAALGELVAEIVHEVRNPLVSVKTFLQLLPSRLDDREFLEDFRQVVIDEVARLERLLDSVLQHSRPNDGDEANGTACVGEAFERVARLLDHRASERRVRLERPVEANAPQVAMSRDALRQVVLNLTLNALDAAPAGGTVRLDARSRSGSDGRWVEIRVEDDGPGIAPADRRRIFETFYSTRADRPGGLGLAISRRLVETAGGSIRAGEAEGGGAAISVRLPAGPRR